MHKNLSLKRSWKRRRPLVPGSEGVMDWPMIADEPGKVGLPVNSPARQSPLHLLLGHECLLPIRGSSIVHEVGGKKTSRVARSELT